MKPISSIPKRYRTPRPMGAAAPRRAAPGARLRLEVFATLAGAAIAALGPLAHFDDALRARAVVAIGRREPPADAVALTVAPADVRGGRCGDAIADALAKGGARGALIVPPVDGLCPVAPRQGGAVVAVLPRDLARVTGRGDVVGFREPDPPRPDLASIGLRGARWLAPSNLESSPTVALGDVASGRVAAEVLAGRVAVVAVDDDVSARRARSLVAALGALSSGRTRDPAPPFLAAVFVAVAATAGRIAQRRRGGAATFAVLAAALVVLAAGGLLAAAVSARGLVAAASTALGLGVSFAGLAAAGAFTSHRAIARAGELLQRAALLRMQGLHGLADAEFWPRVARLAAGAIPSDYVLVAELPTRSWHLRFHAGHGGGEERIGERRRDVRRWPYCDDQGLFTIHVARGVLVDRGVPLVVVPLVAFGDLEGYVFLCGEDAAATHEIDPARTTRLARELALLARRKRLGGRLDDERRQVGLLEVDPAERAVEELVTSAGLAQRDAQLFGEVLARAPVALLYADAFGDVRVVSDTMAPRLALAGVALPDVAGALPPGTLSLADALLALTGPDGADDVARVLSGEPVVGRRIVRPELSQQPLALTVRAVRQAEGGLSFVAGFAASLVELERSRTSDLPFDAGGALVFADPPDAVRVDELVERVLRHVSRKVGRPLAPPDPMPATEIVARGPTLSVALERFLADAGPKVTVQIVERPHQIEIRVHHVELGVPPEIVTGALAAPASAPAGLDALAELAHAVASSFGALRAEHESGWSLRLDACFHRATPDFD